MITLKGSTASYVGLSTDTKPTDCPVNSIFAELDTNKSYFFDGTDWQEMVRGGSGGTGVTEEVKEALLALFRNVAYTSSSGEDLYEDLYDAFYSGRTLQSISAVYTQSGAVYPTDSLNDLKSDLVVTATWSDGTTSVIPSTDYALSGTLTVGTSTITVSYGGQTDTFTVNVTAVYAVTNNLTNCSNSNQATTITAGSSYSATITADNGYTLDSVTCTMGGTAQTVTGGVISIANVTGNIVITASATQEATGLLHYVDFTESLVDQITGDTVSAIVNGKYASAAPVRDSSGLKFTNIAQFATIAQISYPCTIEVGIGTSAIANTSTNNRLIMLGSAFDYDGIDRNSANGWGPLIYRNGESKWSCYAGSWYNYQNTIANRDGLANSVVKVYIDSSGLSHTTVDGVDIGASTGANFLSKPYLQLGTASNVDGVNGLTVEYIKIYDGEV